MPGLSGILAFDQATTSGWAWAEPGQEPVWGHWRSGKREAWEGEVFNAFRFSLHRLIGQHKPDCVGFESPFVPRPDRSGAAKTLNPATLRRAYGFVAHITEMVEAYGVGQIEEVQSSEFTKFFTGKGRFPGETAEARTANKRNAIVAACRARGWEATHDEAVAIALLMFVEYKLYPRESIGRGMKLRLPRGPLFGT